MGWGEGEVVGGGCGGPEWGQSRNSEPKILATGMCSASQIVSHTLSVWRLKISGSRSFTWWPWHRARVQAGARMMFLSPP